MKKIGGKPSRNRGEDFVGSSNTGIFQPKCAKTRQLQASIISKIFPGGYTSEPPSIKVRERDGRVKGKLQARKAEVRNQRHGGQKKVVRFFNGEV
jgi:hypothetical protein